MPTVQTIKDSYPTVISGVTSVFNTLSPVPNLDTFISALIEQSYTLLDANFYGNYYEYALSLWIASKLTNVIKSGGNGGLSGTFNNVSMRRVDQEYEVRYANFLAQSASEFFKNEYDIELDALDKMLTVPFIVY